MPDEESGFMEPLYHIHPDLAREIEEYAKFFDPSAVEVSFRRPKQTLDDTPTQVLVNLDGLGEIFLGVWGGLDPTYV